MSDLAAHRERGVVTHLPDAVAPAAEPSRSGCCVPTGSALSSPTLDSGSGSVRSRPSFPEASTCRQVSASARQVAMVTRRGRRRRSAVRRGEGYVEGLRASATYLAEMYDDAAELPRLPVEARRDQVGHCSTPPQPRGGDLPAGDAGLRLAHPSDADTTSPHEAVRDVLGAGLRDLSATIQRGRALPGSDRAPGVHRFATPEAGLDRISALLWEYASDDEVLQNLPGKANWYARSAHKYFLYEYERSFAKSDTDVIAWSDIVDAKTRKTTEHILPQNPDPESNWKDFFTRAEQDELRHTLGNLVLTYDNSSYSNKEYEEKRGSPDSRTRSATSPHRCARKSTSRPVRDLDAAESRDRQS